jgi:hypothetical protein
MFSGRSSARYLILFMWIALTGITISTGYRWSARSKRFRERDEEAKALSAELKSRPVTTEDPSRNARRAEGMKDSADSTAEMAARVSDSMRHFYWQALGWVVLTFAGAALLARAR